MADIVSEIDRPDGVLPVTIETVSGLVAEIKRLRATVEQQAASLAEKDKEIERLRSDKSAGFAFWRATAKRFADARRAALSRAEQAERALAEAVEVIGFYANKGNWSSPSSGFALQRDPEPSAVHKDWGAKAAAFVAQHGSDSRGE